MKSVQTVIQKTLDQEALVRDFWNNVSQVNEVYDNRNRRNIIYKHSFFVCVRELTSLSLSSIGKQLNKDHATVLHACKKHTINYMYDGHYRGIYDKMYSQLEDLINSFNDDLTEMIERKIKNMDVELYNTAVIDMYKKKLDVQNKSYKLQIESMKKEMRILRKALKTSRERETLLNTECLRLKNLL